MRYANHARARQEARQLISFIDLNRLPIDPFFIINELHFYLEPYSKHEKDCPLAIEVLRKKKCEAITTQDPATGIYHIRYDDGPHIPEDRLRFTIAHEIGHAWQNHIQEFGLDCARHGGIINKNHPAEKEADSFAGELLRSPILMALLNVESVYDIQDICNISYQAASVGARQVKQIKGYMHKTCKEEIAFYSNQFYSFIHQKLCIRCGNYFVSERANYCPICGSNQLYWGNSRGMTYEFIINPKGIKPMIYDNFKHAECPTCNNEEIDDNANYCKICGTFLKNMCAGRSEDIFTQQPATKPCGVVLDANARICMYCGAPSTFYKNKLLQHWEEERNMKIILGTSDEEIPF